MSILQFSEQPPPRFQAYDAAIRREYAWVPDATYETKRRSILQRFLNRPFIYYHQDLRDAFEAQARCNLTTRLAATTTPGA